MNVARGIAALLTAMFIDCGERTGFGVPLSRSNIVYSLG